MKKFKLRSKLFKKAQISLEIIFSSLADPKVSDRLTSEAEVSVDTIKRLERIAGPVSANVTTVDAIVAALRSYGAEFTNGSNQELS